MYGYQSGIRLSGRGAWSLNISTFSQVKLSPYSNSRASIIASVAERCPPPVSENKNRIWGFLFGVGIVISGKDYLNAAGKFAAGQHDPVTAGAAFQANIRAETGNIPLETAARMWFAHAYNVVQLKVRKHGLPGGRLRGKVLATMKIIPYDPSRYTNDERNTS